MSLVPGTLFSRFQVVSLLGSGGMGEVYSAWDPSLKRHVALKILSPETIASEERRGRLTREARAASALNHPNIVTVYEIGQALVDQSPVDFIAMELIEGETLRSLLSRRVDMTKALHYLAQTADGLAKAHAAGILHRDLKPANIMLTPDGFAKILDFGLARNSGLEDGDDAAGAAVVDTITRPGVMMGTVGYMSPEQVRGLPLDQRSDIFSFGCILYEVLTRRRPFQGSSQVDTLHKTAYEPPPQIGDVDPPVPDALRRVALKCLAKDPEARYQSAKEIAIDLREIKRDYESNLHSSNALFPRTPPGPGMRRGLWLIVAITVLIAATGAWLWSQREQPQSHSRTGSLQSMRIERLPATSKVRAVAISPDGRYIAHVESTPGGDVLMVRQVTTGSEIEAAPAVGKNYEELSFSPDGEYIRYVHDGALRQSPVLGGSGKILIDNFSYPVSFSPDGKRCAFVRDQLLFVVNSDGTGERQISGATNGPLVGYVRPSWSPRGDLIACTRRSPRRTDKGNMWVEIVKPPIGNAAPGLPVTLGDGWYEITSISWLPGADGIAVSAKHQSLIERQLYEITYPGGETKRQTNDLFEYDGVGVTRDGKVLVSRQADRRSSIWLIPVGNPKAATRIIEGVGLIRHLVALANGDVIYGASSGGNSDIWRTTLDGTQRKRLTDDPGADLMPDVSPDGRTVAFMSDRSGQVTIWMMDADGAHQRQLTSHGRDSRPRFSADGKSLVYNSQDGPQSLLYKMSLPGGQRARIPTPYTRLPVFSPDGRFIAAVNGESRKLAVISAADGSLVRSFDEQSTHGLRWTKDSSAIALARDGAVYLQRLSGGKAEKIADVSPDEILSFDWTPDEKSLLVARVSNQWSAVMLKDFR